MRVAAGEKDGYKAALEGVYGEKQQEYAQAAGLRGIVEHWMEYSNRWEIEDIITGDKHTRMFKPVKFGKRKFQCGNKVELFRIDHAEGRGGKLLGVTADHKLLIRWSDNDETTEHDPQDLKLEMCE